ncbi:unnamed protein product [Prorocentrum cordatum]|uniref:Ubiquitin-like domain-containing protein n=1 Tax=Prorocentrum cordatum TaxID=2364126 RepID=A0ABN9QJI3_9DINO|nr:unnamed protein product [Polarella glacialis]
MQVSVVASLTGRQLLAVQASPTWGPQDLLRRLPGRAAADDCRRRIFWGATELSSACSLGDLGVTDGARLSLVVSRPLHVLTASGDGAARIWSAPSGECLRTLRGHDGSVLSAAFSPTATRW